MKKFVGLPQRNHRLIVDRRLVADSIEIRVVERLRVKCECGESLDCRWIIYSSIAQDESRTGQLEPSQLSPLTTFSTFYGLLTHLRRRRFVHKLNNFASINYVYARLCRLTCSLLIQPHVIQTLNKSTKFAIFLWKIRNAHTCDSDG